MRKAAFCICENKDADQLRSTDGLAHHANTPLHYVTTPMRYTVIFHDCKNDYFQMKNCDIFLDFAQNIDRGNRLEPASNEYLQSMF